MRVTLTVVDGPHKGQVFTFAGHDTFLVGRSKRAHFRLPTKDRFFSRVHFLVEVNPPQCRLMDMNSRNGTYVNGQRVEVADLKHKDQIRAGHTILSVRVEQTNVASDPPASDSAYAIPLPPAIPAPPPEVLSALSKVTAPPSLAPSLCLACEVPLATPSRLCPDCQVLIQGQDQPIAGFQIIRPLGQGAMGVVYLAIREADQSLVALKTVIPAVHGTPTQMDRFLREADILRQLTHPNIVAFRESGECDGKLFFAMDYVRGHDANRLLHTEGPLPIARAAGLVCQLLEALEYAHGCGFVHRDIKPANLLLTTMGGREVVRLADFGLARVYQASQFSGLTMTGEFGGTMAFMAPEQVTHYREVRPPVDQYASAATLYNLLTDQYVYDLPRELSRQIGLILNEDPVPIRTRRPDVPEGLASIIHRALARDPGDRFPSARDFHTELARFR